MTERAWEAWKGVATLSNKGQEVVDRPHLEETRHIKMIEWIHIFLTDSTTLKGLCHRNLTLVNMQRKKRNSQK